jgi:indole-3-glycerol phosphate synthase
MVETTLETQTILDAIVADKRADLESRRKVQPIEIVRAQAFAGPRTLRLAPRLRGTTVKLIAEIKRASPAAGLLEQEFNPVERAMQYALGGAAGISVLTEERRFLGSLEDLINVRKALTAHGEGRPPLLRKDFLFDPYQIYEARAAGADAILLIVAILPAATLKALLTLARELDLSAIVEVHAERELETALSAGAEIIGINNRDLRTFATSIEVTERLRPLIPPGPVVVSESGIHQRGDIKRLAAARVDAVLVGEALMRSADAASAVRDFACVPSQAGS